MGRTKNKQQKRTKTITIITDLADDSWVMYKNGKNVGEWWEEPMKKPIEHLAKAFGYEVVWGELIPEEDGGQMFADSLDDLNWRNHGRDEE